MISLRFTVGGSAACTARALAVNLQDGGLYRCQPSEDLKEPFAVVVLQKGVLFDLGADNTPSALNVSLEISKLSGEPCGVWKCPTHVIAMDSKTPNVQLCGDAGKDFNFRNALNISNKWWYVCTKHGELVRYHWSKARCVSKVSSAMLSIRGLMGKWESMGKANAVIFYYAEDIRKFVVYMEYFATGMPGLGSLKKDCQLLAEWMHHPEVWFQFLVCHDWFENYMDPLFIRLRSPAKIHPESGPFMGRQIIPKIALDAICRAADMPVANASDAAVEAKVKKYFPNAHTHARLSADVTPRGIGGWQRFEIPSQDRQAYFRGVATKFGPALVTNADKHWRPFLQGWKIAGLVTDPEVGAYTARVLVKLLSRSAVSGGEPNALGLLRTPQLDEIDKIAISEGGEIAACLAAEGLFNSPARQAEWVRMCSPEGRIELDWTRAMQPELAPWFESRFYGAHRCNYPLESTFSTFGGHVEDEQGGELKESIVCLADHLQHARAKRMLAEMRTPKVSAKAQEKYVAAAANRAAAGEKEDLHRDSESRKQLLSRATTLLERMAVRAEVGAETVGTCDELGGISVADFRKRRNLQWDLLFKREAKALEAVMVAKREKGRAKRPTDPFGRVRATMKARLQASYLEAAEKLVQAEAAVEAAERAAAEEQGDASDDEAEPQPKKRRNGAARGKN